MLEKSVEETRGEESERDIDGGREVEVERATATWIDKWREGEREGLLVLFSVQPNMSAATSCN